MARSFGLGLYRAATRLATPLGGAFLEWRARRGKEDRERIDERKGLAGEDRPEGRLAWLHGASVGEGLSLLPLVARLTARGFRVLVTTGTVTSARLMGERLPPGAIHQYMPLDLPLYVARFLDHWRPDIVLLSESELWPNVIAGLAGRKIPLVLANARMSARSFSRWRRAAGPVREMLGRIDLCLAQSQEDAARFLSLGAPRVQVAGNLKYDNPPPSADPAETAALKAAIGARPVWAAASTHVGEELIAGEAHVELAKRFPNLLTLIVPRHPQRADDIEAQLNALGVRTARRSQRAVLTAQTAVYLCDTIGEMGLFLRLSPVVFIGKSLTGEGGQNPIEAAKLGCAILHGPHVSNCAESYELLDDARGAACVEDAEGLTKGLGVLLSDAAKLRAMARAALEAVSGQSGAGNRIMSALEPYIAQISVERRR